MTKSKTVLDIELLIQVMLVEMDERIASAANSIACVGIVLAVVWGAWRVVNFVWLRPKKLEKLLREVGFDGNPYRLLYGDLRDFFNMAKEAKFKPISLFDDIPSHILPFQHHIVNKYGKNSFVWFGPIPRLHIMDPGHIKEVLTKHNVFHRPHPDPITDMVVGGLLKYEEDDWARHRKIVSSAFLFKHLKSMIPAMQLSCSGMIKEWEKLTSAKGYSEVDVWPYLEDFSGDVISRTAFGSSHQEGKRIFQLQKEQVDLAFKLIKLIHVPGGRFLPTKSNKRMNVLCSEIRTLLRGIIEKREKALGMGEANNDDLLGMLLEANLKEIQEYGNNNKNIGLNIEEVMEECKLFYFAGSESTSNLLVWTMVLLSKYSEWQERARKEILQIFGTRKPDFGGLNSLKVVTMILYEVLRLYPPATMILRALPKSTKLGDMTLPAGTGFIVPIILIHHDKEIWGEDAHEFKPERFAEGVSNATKHQFSYIPFGGGPKICVGQNFALIEAQMALTAILQNFTFELSPSYKHAPFSVVTLQPQYGAQMILHKL